MARMSLTVPHFNNPHVYFIDLVSISPWTFSSVPRDPASSNRETNSNCISGKRPEAKPGWSIPDLISFCPYCQAPHSRTRWLFPLLIHWFQRWRFRQRRRSRLRWTCTVWVRRSLADLVAGFDVSGLDNENGCCHLNAVLIMLFSCRMLRRFFGPHECFPSAEGEVWRELIQLRCEISTRITQSTLEL
jgi:hypothetical protein